MEALLVLCIIFIIALIINSISQGVKIDKIVESQNQDKIKLIWVSKNPPAFHIGQETKHGTCYDIKLTEAQFVSNAYGYEFRFKKDNETVLVYQGRMGVN